MNFQLSKKEAMFEMVQKIIESKRIICGAPRLRGTIWKALFKVLWST